DRNRSHWSTSKTPSYTKSVSWQHHRNLKPNTEPVNILLSNNFIRINKNIRLSDLTHFLISNLHTQNVYPTQEPLTHDDIDILRLCVSYSLKQIAIIKGIDYKTVSYHKIRALNKLNIKGTVELFIALCEWDKHYFKLQSCVRES
ncbi:LuxR C-terminal-related transcriptional regulator, partial [Escherichia coli]|uniref:helix-turn-helix transcriptional regulator n=1 Tax=Escherichia sp. NIC18-1 TaxID=2870770 RepID=UPI0021AE9C68